MLPGKTEPQRDVHSTITGIEEPLLFSSRALDISMDGICSLIRSYFASKDLWQKGARRWSALPNKDDLAGAI